MSRSYKYPVWKQRNDQGYKKYSNKRIRKFINTLSVGLKGTKLIKQLLCSYDICDYRWYPRNEEDKLKAKRK
jgi:hypothetical protein